MPGKTVKTDSYAVDMDFYNKLINNQPYSWSRSCFKIFDKAISSLGPALAEAKPSLTKTQVNGGQTGTSKPYTI